MAPIALVREPYAGILGVRGNTIVEWELERGWE